MNTERFFQRVSRLKEHPSVDPGTVAAIADWILRTDASNRVRIYLHSVSTELGRPISELMPPFLYGVPMGLFDLHWDTHCPSCSGVVHPADNLSQLCSETYCSWCEKGTLTDFSSDVEVTFSLNREIEDSVEPTCETHGSRGLSGFALMHSPIFRALFGDQVLSDRERLQIAAATVLFTDISHSTRMYEELGDAVAYNLVRDHFDILFRATEAQGGTVLKTIGDSVMASFPANVQALRSVLAAFSELRQYNRSRPPERRIEIKVGVHRGPVILVNFNNRLDYFGATVNKAARLQGISESREVSFSEELYRDEGAMEVLREHGIDQMRERHIKLRGMASTHTIYQVQAL